MFCRFPFSEMILNSSRKKTINARKCRSHTSNSRYGGFEEISLIIHQIHTLFNDIIVIMNCVGFKLPCLGYLFNEYVNDLNLRSTTFVMALSISFLPSILCALPNTMPVTSMGMFCWIILMKIASYPQNALILVNSFIDST